ncbi:glycoside hydrolase N-terminal domain-containing protein [Verrucomicrobiota bacterium]
MAHSFWSSNRNTVIHGVRHQSAPRIWQDGFPLGNGFLGAMLWGDGRPLNLTLDCADLFDSRTDDRYWKNPAYTYAHLRELIEARRYEEAEAIFGTPSNAALTPAKISIGRATIGLGAVAAYDCRLDLDRAVVTGSLGTDRGEIALAAFVHRERNVICLRLQSENPSSAELDFIPLVEVCKEMAALKHPPPLTRTDGNKRVWVQQIPEGPAYAMVWNATGPDHYLAIECADDAAAAEVKAKATWEWAAKRGFDSLRASHERAWKTFWDVSAVFLPERRMEFFWYFGLYLLASSARRGAMPPGLQGVWAMDGVMPPWTGTYTCDMNVQETFWPAYVAGHLDLADVWCDFMLECVAPAQAYTQKVFGTEGMFWPGGFAGKFKLCDPSNWYSGCFSWATAGWLVWLPWLRWRHSMDREWLARTGYPVVSEVFKFYRANLVEEPDGRLHVPLSDSPEYHRNDARESFCKDPNIDLALIRRCCDWIVEMETALGKKDLSADALRIKERMAPYALTEQGALCLWPGKALDESHRHPSHLMAIHPAMDWTIDDGEEIRKRIDASVDQYMGLGKNKWWGFTYAQLVGFAAVLGRGEWAYDCLRQFADHWVMPNGLHVNADWRGTNDSEFGSTRKLNRQSAPFTYEANCGVCAGISDMLLQGWRDVVRVFPAVPGHWRELAFRDLVTEGAWKVSAVRHLSRTVWVKVTATVPGTLRLLNPFDGGAADVLEGEAVLKNGFYEAILTAGQSVILQRNGYRFDEKVVISSVREEEPSLLGLPRKS